MDLEDALWRAMTRSELPEDIHELVDILGGTNEAAEILGVTQRTVQRYITTGTQKRAISADKLATLQQAVRSSPDARRAALNPRRESRIRNHGTKLGGKAQAGRRTGERYDLRPRDLTHHDIDLSGAAMADVIDLWLAGDDAGAADALREAIDEEYLGGFVLGDIDDLTFRR